MASNLPPGVTIGMIDDHFADRPCEMCGHYPDDCICPECPVCYEHGNPACYSTLGGHGLTESWDQRIGKAKAELYNLQERVVDQQQYIDWLENEKAHNEDPSTAYMGK